MTTSKRNGFLTASCLILLLCFAVSGGTISLVLAQNLSENSISWFDREFINGKEELKAIEAQINADPRFPDFISFKAYLALNPKMLIRSGRSTLVYINTMIDPAGGLRHRFTLSETVSGRTYERPVTADESPDGKTTFCLSGIAY